MWFGLRLVLASLGLGHNGFFVDIKEQVTSEINVAGLFALQLDESTDLS